MASKMILRAGVTWRGSKCVVEMRPPLSKWRLHFGSYDTEFEAMFARDYAAILRDSAAEDATTAGGFNHHSNLCEFDESHVVFKSTDVFTVRCAEYKRLLEENRKENRKENCANSPFKEFCKEARKDITIAIEEFRKRYPHKLQPATKDLAPDLPKLDGGTHFTPPPSSFEGESSESSLVAEHKRLVHEYIHKENFPSGSGTFDPPDGKSCHVIRGFHGDSMFGGQPQEKSLAMQENSTCKMKDSKSLLQVQLANGNSVEPCQEPGLKMQDDDTVPGFNSSSYESYNSQQTFTSVVTSNCDQSTSIAYSGVPGSSLSAGMSVDDEMGLSSHNCNNLLSDLEVALNEERFALDFAEGDGDIFLKEGDMEDYFAEGEGGQLQRDLSPHVDVDDHFGNGAGDSLKNDIILLYGASEDQTQMGIDEADIPMLCRRTISHKEETENTMLKIAKAQLEITVERKKKLKIENWRMAKDDGVISNEEYIQQVKALLDL